MKITAQIKTQNNSATGTNPFAKEQPQIQEGDSIQKATGKLGDQAKWQETAKKNDIENPRFPPSGTRLKN